MRKGKAKTAESEVKEANVTVEEASEDLPSEEENKEKNEGVNRFKIMEDCNKISCTTQNNRK